MPLSVHSANIINMEEEFNSNLTVVDVFDLASEIGKEFEKIIEQFGPDAVTSIMPKVIIALEHLEGLASKNERENTQMQELVDQIAKLEHEKAEKNQDRLRFEKEVEEIEESWKEETKELVNMVNNLQEEKKKLTKLLEEKESASGRSAYHPLSPEIDISVLQKLRCQVDTLREQLRNKDRELSNKNCDIDNLKRQIERLSNTSRELRRKQRLNQVQVRGLIDERADFLAALQDHQREVVSLKQRLGLAEKENEDLYNSQSELPDLTNKAIYDLDDPNRPRFTTSELKEILHERNQLKTKVGDLEEELDSLKQTAEQAEECDSDSEKTEFADPQVRESTSSNVPRETSKFVQRMAMLFPSVTAVITPTPTLPGYHIPSSVTPSSTGEDKDDTPEEERPVQGPMPFEPDDAPWKKNESGVRKFFRKLFSETSSISILPINSEKSSGISLPFRNKSPSKSVVSRTSSGCSSSSALTK